MIRDGTRWNHAGAPITPLLLVARDGTQDWRCLVCRRPVHTSPRAGGWRHHQRRWSGRRRARTARAAA